MGEFSIFIFFESYFHFAEMCFMVSQPAVSFVHSKHVFDVVDNMVCFTKASNFFYAKPLKLVMRHRDNDALVNASSRIINEISVSRQAQTLTFYHWIKDVYSIYKFMKVFN